MKRSAALALLLLAAACETPRPTVAEYLGVLDGVVRFAEEDARRNAVAAVPGELMVDVESFRGGGWWLTRQTVPPQSVVAAIRTPFEAFTPNEAMACEEGDMGGCWIRGYGVLVRMNLTKHTAREMLVMFTSYTTDRRTFPTELCERVWRVRFRKDDVGKYELLNRELRRVTCEGSGTTPSAES